MVENADILQDLSSSSILNQGESQNRTDNVGLSFTRMLPDASALMGPDEEEAKIPPLSGSKRG